MLNANEVVNINNVSISATAKEYGFRDIHPEFSFRKQESFDHERVTNAKPGIIGNYFDVLHATLEEQNVPLR